MKIYIRFLIIILASMSCISCNNMLDLDTDGHTNLDGVFSDRNNVRGYLNTCYSYRGGVPLDVSYLTDEAQDCSYKVAGSMSDYWYNVGLTVDNYTSYSYDGNPWENYYEGIRKCNVFISRMPTATAYCTDTERAGWLAQARVLRAFYYLQLFKRYGQIPLVTKDLGTTANYTSAKKAKVGEIVKQILADCDSALLVENSQFGFPWAVYDDQTGAMTRAVAYAIESEAIIYAVSPLFDDGTYTWTDALKITKEALYQCVSNDYSLWNIVADNAQNAYASYFLASPYDRRSIDKESIYAIDSQFAIWQNAGLPSNDGVSQAGPCPSQELVDAYDMSNGEPAIIGYSDADHLKPIINPSSGYDDNYPYNNRDPRFYATIYYNGAIRYLNDPSSVKVQTYEGGTEGIDQTTLTHTKTGYYIRKFNDYRSTKYSNSDGYMRIFRLAELYLNFAEAAYQVVGNTPDTKISVGSGLELSARDAVDSIRRRACMPDLPMGLSKTDFQTRYRNERRIEFAMEGHRFFDVRRWKNLNDLKVLTGMDIITDGSNVIYKRFRFNDRVTTVDKYLLYPLDRAEVNKMLKLTGVDWQNPSW